MRFFTSAALTAASVAQAKVNHRDHIETNLISTHGASSNAISALSAHGCWGAHMNADNFNLGQSGGANRVDDLDEVMAQWFNACNCLELDGGECDVDEGPLPSACTSKLNAIDARYGPLVAAIINDGSWSPVSTGFNCPRMIPRADRTVDDQYESCANLVPDYVSPCASVDCGDHGQCVNAVCVCDGGWAGDSCDTDACAQHMNTQYDSATDSCACLPDYRSSPDFNNGEGCPIYDGRICAKLTTGTHAAAMTDKRLYLDISISSAPGAEFAVATQSCTNKSLYPNHQGIMVNYVCCDMAFGTEMSAPTVAVSAENNNGWQGKIELEWTESDQQTKNYANNECRPSLGTPPTTTYWWVDGNNKEGWPNQFSTQNGYGCANRIHSSGNKCLLQC